MKIKSCIQKWLIINHLAWSFELQTNKQKNGKRKRSHYTEHNRQGKNHNGHKKLMTASAFMVYTWAIRCTNMNSLDFAEGKFCLPYMCWQMVRIWDILKSCLDSVRAKTEIYTLTTQKDVDKISSLLDFLGYWIVFKNGISCLLIH